MGAYCAFEPSFAECGQNLTVGLLWRGGERGQMRGELFYFGGVGPKSITSLDLNAEPDCRGDQSGRTPNRGNRMLIEPLISTVQPTPGCGVQTQRAIA